MLQRTRLVLAGIRQCQDLLIELSARTAGALVQFYWETSQISPRCMWAGWVQATLEEVRPAAGGAAQASSFTVTLSSPANLWGELCP